MKVKVKAMRRTRCVVAICRGRAKASHMGKADVTYTVIFHFDPPRTVTGEILCC